MFSLTIIKALDCVTSNPNLNEEWDCLQYCSTEPESSTNTALFPSENEWSQSVRISKFSHIFSETNSKNIMILFEKTLLIIKNFSWSAHSPWKERNSHPRRNWWSSRKICRQISWIVRGSQAQIRYSRRCSSNLELTHKI